MKTLIIKSLLTSLYQREVMYPSLEKRPMARSQRLIEGKGRFFNNDALLMNSLITHLNSLLYDIKKAGDNH
jgi:hypothetical protein